MWLPAFTVAGTALSDNGRTRIDETVVAIAVPARGAVSLLSMLKVALVITVPFARGLATCTTSCTEPELPAFRAPMFQVTTPAARAPPPVADTKLVLPGTVSVIMTPLALAFPVFEYDSV